MTEGEIQKQVFAHLKKRAMPGVFAFHVPNHKRARRAAGFVPGVPDVIAVKDGTFYAIELKTEKNGPDEDQLKAIGRINDAGGFAVVCHGLDRALSTLETWGLLRKAA